MTPPSPARGKKTGSGTSQDGAGALGRNEKLELIQRSLGLRHKIKVHDSVKAPETHEELARMILAKWELEDELHAIEERLAQDRAGNVARKLGEISASD